jgi:hypothetical protein
LEKGVVAQGLLLQIMQCNLCQDFYVPEVAVQEVLEEFPICF